MDDACDRHGTRMNWNAQRTGNQDVRRQAGHTSPATSYKSALSLSAAFSRRFSSNESLPRISFTVASLNSENMNLLNNSCLAERSAACLRAFSESDISTTLASSREDVRFSRDIFSSIFDCVVTNDGSTRRAADTSLTGTPRPWSRSDTAIRIIHCGPVTPRFWAQKSRI